jgi:hypothetical protein
MRYRDEMPFGVHIGSLSADMNVCEGQNAHNRRERLSSTIRAVCF